MKQITKDVEGGSTLAEALKKHPKVFRHLTGLTVEKFEELLHTLNPIYNDAEEKRLYKSYPLQSKNQM